MELAGFDWMECDEEDAVRRVYTAMALATRIPEKEE
jgi:hypothetical protein